MEFDFSEWKKQEIHQGKIFIEDGVFDTKAWKDANPKILFLAKEAYSNGDEFILRDLIDEYGPFQNWFRVAYWTKAIEMVWEYKSIPTFERIDDKEIKEILKRIAFVNIKKSGGLSSSNNKDLQKYVNSDRKYLKSQINYYQPDVIICCYTFEPGFYDEIFEGDEIVEKSQWVYEHKVGNKHRLVIDYWHFANRFPDSMNFFTLCAVMMKYFQEVKK